MPEPDYSFPREKRFLFMFAFCACLFVFVSNIQLYDRAEDVSILNWFFILMSLISGGLGLWWVRFRISIPVMEDLKPEEAPMYITNHWIVSLVFFWVISIFGVVLAVQAVKPLYAWCYSSASLALIFSHWFQLQRIGGVMRHFEELGAATANETTDDPNQRVEEEH